MWECVLQGFAKIVFGFNRTMVRFFENKAVPSATFIDLDRISTELLICLLVKQAINLSKRK